MQQARSRCTRNDRALPQKGYTAMATHHNDSTFTAEVNVKTTHPALMPLVEDVKRFESGSVDHALALARLFAALAAEGAATDGYDNGYDKGRVKGYDEGA